MARTIAEIKKEMTDTFMQSQEVKVLYGIEEGKSFDDTFSKVSIESLIFYVVAVAIYTLEALFSQHQKEVNTVIEEWLPHRLNWYKNKALAFMYGKELNEFGEYNTDNMLPSIINAAKVVKYAAVTEDRDTGRLIIKVAGEKDNKRTPLDDMQESNLGIYLNEIKDAGVRFEIVNKKPDVFTCTIDVRINPLVITDKNVFEEILKNALSEYLENLPFGGVFTNSGAIDALQKIAGITDVFMFDQTATPAEGESCEFGARYTPVAGYLSLGEIKINYGNE